MATLILTAVGNMIGGPIGGAIGGIIGQNIDQRIFAPKAREGPRLGDLSIQTSSYGNALPKLFGAVRVSGTVIWATDMIETRQKQSTGKGQPKATTYSYSANFAVALSARPIVSIGRMWADGKLLRGTAGDFKIATQFRVHSGREDQAIDALIASVEGIANAPAYRGLAYVVFEDFQLAEFGNRIPSLSFEVFADNGSITLGEIISSLAPDGADIDCPSRLDGFVLSRGTRRGAIEALSEIIPVRVTGQSPLRIAEVPGPMSMIAEEALGAVSGEQRSITLATRRGASERLPKALALHYADPERDYQPGSQTARWTSGADEEEVLSLPATLAAAVAAELVQRTLSLRWWQRDQIEITLPLRYAYLKPGQRLIIPNVAAEMQIRHLSLEAMVVRLGLEPYRSLSMTIPQADPGRVQSEADLVTGQTRLELIDLPFAPNGVATKPQLFVAACGTGPGWRSANLLASFDDGINWTEAGPTAAPATMGTTLSYLPPGQSLPIQTDQFVDIEISSWMSPPVSTDQQGLLDARNIALIGNEIVLFETVQQLSITQFRLSGLVRGWRSPDLALAGHALGERFMLIDADSLAYLSAPSVDVSARVMASGVGDLHPVERIATTLGRALQPLSPVHLSVQRLASGSIDLTWVRRSRDGWRWIDGLDAPLAEETERYSVMITPDQGTSQSYETTEAAFLFSSGMIAAFVAGGATHIDIQIKQIGTYALSLPLTTTIPL